MNRCRVPAEIAGHLGYLLKHVHLWFFELAAAALAPTGINGREAAGLRAVDNPRPPAQGEIAHRMGIDLTTMVLLIEAQRPGHRSVAGTAGSLRSAGLSYGRRCGRRSG